MGDTPCWFPAFEGWVRFPAITRWSQGGRRVCWRGPGCLEQRYRAVPEVLDEWVPVTVVARRYGVARQTVHGWLRRYANEDRELESR